MKRNDYITTCKKDKNNNENVNNRNFVTPTPHERKLDIGQLANFVTASQQKVIKAIFTIFSSEFKTSDVLNTSIFLHGSEAFLCLSIPKSDLNTKKTPLNIEVCPESLRASC